MCIAVAFLLKGSGSFKPIIGEVAATLALDAVLSQVPGGFLASLVMGLESDESPAQRAARKLNEQIDMLLSALPDVGSLSAEELLSTREALKTIIQNMPVIKEPPTPTPPIGIQLPGFQYSSRPDWA